MICAAIFLKKRVTEKSYLYQEFARKPQVDLWITKIFTPNNPQTCVKSAKPLMYKASFCG